jgi:hypothetical protein
LTNGISYLAAGSNITITTGSTGQVTIAGAAAATQWVDRTNSLTFSGTVGIGITSAAAYKLVVNANTTTPPITSSTETVAQFVGTNSTAPEIVIDAYGSTSTAHYPHINFRRAQGTLSSPTVLQGGNIIGRLDFSGYADSGFVTTPAASIFVKAPDSGDWSDTWRGTCIVLSTTMSRSTVLTERVKITENGNVNIYDGTGNKPDDYYAMTQDTKLVVSNNTAVHSPSYLSNVTSGTTANLAWFVGPDNKGTNIIIQSFGTGSTFSHDPGIIFKRAGGTASGQGTALAADMAIGGFVGLGGSGAPSNVYSAAPRAAVTMYSSQTWTESNQGTYISFKTTANSTRTTTEKLRVHGTGIDVTGSISVTSGITGSLMLLPNGTSYLAAGSNVTITSGSTGQITIAATAGSTFADITVTGGVTGSLVISRNSSTSPITASLITSGTSVYNNSWTATRILHLIGGDKTHPAIVMDSFGSGSALYFRRADGTNAAKTGLAGYADVIGGIYGTGYGPTGPADYRTTPGAAIEFTTAGGSWSSTNSPMQISISTRGLGTLIPKVIGRFTDLGLFLYDGPSYSSGFPTHTVGTLAVNNSTGSAGSIQTNWLSTTYDTLASFTGKEDYESIVVLDKHGSSKHSLVFMKSGGTTTAATRVSLNDDIGGVKWQGKYDPSNQYNHRDVAEIRCVATNDFSTSDAAVGKLVFKTRTFGDAEPISALEIDARSLTVMTGSITLLSGSVDSALGTVKAFAGFSGSLTKLYNGLSYLVAGSNVTITTGSTGQVTISSTVTGGSGADQDAQYIVMAATASLPNERALAAGTGLTITDGGAGGNVTLAIDNNVVATVSGTTFTGATKHNAGLSGSLTQLTDGTSYLIAGSNVTITTGSAGQVTIASSAAAGSGADQDAQYIVVALTSSLANERALAAGTGLTRTDGGAGGNITLALDTSSNAGWVALASGTFTRVSDSTFTVTSSAENSSAFSMYRPIRYQGTSGSWKYGVMSAYTAGSGTLRGAPMTVGDVLELQWSNTFDRLEQINFSFLGNYALAPADRMVSTMLQTFYKWNRGTAYVVGYDIRNTIMETGASKEHVNVDTSGTGSFSAGSFVSTSNSNTGIIPVTGSFTETDVDINVSTYKLSPGQYVEVRCDGSGSNKTSANLTVQMYVVRES